MAQILGSRYQNQSAFILGDILMVAFTLPIKPSWVRIHARIRTHDGLVCDLCQSNLSSTCNSVSFNELFQTFRSFSFYIVRKKEGALSWQTNPFGRILVFLYCVFQIFGRLLLFTLIGYFFKTFYSILVITYLQLSNKRQVLKLSDNIILV